MGGKEYVEQVLQGPLLDFVREMEKRRGHEMLVVEDRAPGPRSVLAKKAHAKLGITQFPHPPSSPDLNPEEPLWLVLKDRVSKIPESRTSLKKLWEAVQRVWDELTEEDIVAHTGQMEGRVQAVKQAKSQITKF